MLLKTASLTDVERAVIIDKATERPFSGKYDDFGDKGTYLCRQCGLALYRSNTKFHSGCGWASFDDQIPGAVKQEPDTDGRRIEILCTRCNAHLGHVFAGERFTQKNLRHCVNSLSLDFVPDLEVKDTEEAIFAAGCFWGVEHLFKKLPGVVLTEVGYSGGRIERPTYEDVCSRDTGHYEVIRVIYDTSKINFEKVAKYFFEIHDPTQKNGQGPDIGEQYLSVAFYYDAEQKKVLEALITELKAKKYDVVTKVLPVSVFWPAEKYHQDYYKKTGSQPYCHHYQKRF